MRKENNYFLEIILLPIVIIIFLVVSITTYNIEITKKQIQKEINHKKSEFINNQKLLISDKVHRLNSQIRRENNKIEDEIRNSLKVKIEIALGITNDIVKQNKGLSKSLISNIVAKRLSYSTFAHRKS